MNPLELDVIVRVAGATLLVWTAIRLRSDGRPYFIAMALCLCSFLAGNTADPDLRLSAPLGSLGVVLTGYAAVFLWWWCLAIFEPGFRPRGPVLALGALWILVASADRGLLGPWIADRGLSRLLAGLGLIMVGHLAWRLLRDRAGDAIDRRRQARAAVVVVLAGQFLADLCIDLILGFDWQPFAFPIIQNAVLLASVAWLQSLDLTAYRIAGRESPIIAPAPTPTASDLAAAERLRHLMEIDRLYLNPALGFADVVTAMGISERQLRRLIAMAGHDHFRTFLNAWRMTEARHRLTDPAHRSDKLIGVAFDCGFASLASFNRVFRDAEGCSPSAFRASAAGEPVARSGSEQRLAGL